MTAGGLSASAQRPSFSMRIGTGSYRLRSRCANTDAADASDTSCSPDRPPYSTPTRRRFTMSEYQQQAGSDQAYAVIRFASRTRTAPARRGVLTTPHGTVQTPAFMPVGTRGAVKGITFRDVRDAGARDHPRQHLSPAPAARRRADRARRRPPRVHRLAASDPDRQRRLPGLQPRGDAEGDRRGRGVPLAPRRRPLRAVARERHRHPGPPRLRHRHGPRRAGRRSEVRLSAVRRPTVR